MPDNARPNLFDYAKKELSQDAMICWLIHWADDHFARADWELHGCGQRFVLALLRKHGLTSPPERIETTIFQQDKSIDVLARVSPNHVLLIEDKTGTSDHGDQLRRYFEHVINGRTQLRNVSEESVYPIYLKTGNQPRCKDRQIEQVTEGFYRPYKVFRRNDFLDVLCAYGGTHHALIEFRDYLERRECSTKSFSHWKKDKRSEWSWESWEGFYRYLEDTLGAGDWSNVSNPSGGFLGFCWSFIRVNGNGGPQIYLQLEASLQNNRHLLCFKVCDAVKERQHELKRNWHERFLEAGGGKVVKPPVMRAGKTMTVGHWKGEWLAFHNGTIDLSGTVANLNVAEQIVRRAAALGNSLDRTAT